MGRLAWIKTALIEPLDQPKKIPIPDFARAIRERFPGEYDNQDDVTLARKTAQAYPEYSSQVDWGEPRSNDDVDELADYYSAANGIDSDFVRRLIGQESGGKSGATSWAGAAGVMQLMPGTAQTLGVKNVRDPHESIQKTVPYIRQLFDKHQGDAAKVLAEYNTGRDLTKISLEQVRKFSNLPKGDPRRGTAQDRTTTGHYIDNILKDYQPPGGYVPSQETDVEDEPTPDQSGAFKGGEVVSVPQHQKGVRASTVQVEARPGDTPESLAARFNVKPEELQVDGVPLTAPGQRSAQAVLSSPALVVDASGAAQEGQPPLPTADIPVTDSLPPTQSGFTSPDAGDRAIGADSELAPPKIVAPETPLYAPRPPAVVPAYNAEEAAQLTGSYGRIHGMGEDVMAQYQKFVQDNVSSPKTGKAPTLDKAAQDEALASTFLKIKERIDAEPGELKGQRAARAIADIGFEFLKDPATKGQQLPPILHTGLLQAKLTPQELEDLPDKLKAQRQQLASQRSAAREGMSTARRNLKAARRQRLDEILFVKPGEKVAPPSQELGTARQQYSAAQKRFNDLLGIHRSSMFEKSEPNIVEIGKRELKENLAASMPKNAKLFEELEILRNFTGPLSPEQQTARLRRTREVVGQIRANAKDFPDFNKAPKDVPRAKTLLEKLNAAQGLEPVANLAEGAESSVGDKFGALFGRSKVAAEPLYRGLVLKGGSHLSTFWSKLSGLVGWKGGEDYFAKNSDALLREADLSLLNERWRNLIETGNSKQGMFSATLEALGETAPVLMKYHLVHTLIVASGGTATPALTMALVAGVENKDKPAFDQLTGMLTSIGEGKLIGTFGKLGRKEAGVAFGAYSAIRSAAEGQDIEHVVASTISGVAVGSGLANPNGLKFTELPKALARVAIKSKVTPEYARDVLADIGKYGKGVVYSEDGRALSLYLDPDTGAVFGNKISAMEGRRYDPAVITGEARNVRQAEYLKPEQFDVLARELGIKAEGAKTTPRLTEGEVAEPVAEKVVTPKPSPAPKPEKPLAPLPKVEVEKGTERIIEAGKPTDKMVTPRGVEKFKPENEEATTQILSVVKPPTELLADADVDLVRERIRPEWAGARFTSEGIKQQLGLSQEYPLSLLVKGNLIKQNDEGLWEITPDVYAEPKNVTPAKGATDAGQKILSEGRSASGTHNQPGVIEQAAGEQGRSGTPSIRESGKSKEGKVEEVSYPAAQAVTDKTKASKGESNVLQPSIEQGNVQTGEGAPIPTSARSVETPRPLFPSRTDNQQRIERTGNAPSTKQSTPSSASELRREPKLEPLAPPSKVEGKEPWERTREELFNDTDTLIRLATDAGVKGETYQAFRGKGKTLKVVEKNKPLNNQELFDFGKEYHRKQVESALREGKPVPPEVLADYPDLQVVQETPTPEKAKASIKTEKINSKTGMTPTQSSYLAGKLREVADEGVKTAGTGHQSVKELSEKFGGDVSTATFEMPLEEPVTIEVPGDGAFTIKSVAQANRLHQKVTGKPIEGLEKAKNAAVPRGTSQRVTAKDRGVSEYVEWAEEAYGGAKQAAEKLKRQLESITSSEIKAEYADIELRDLANTVAALEARAAEAAENEARQKIRAMQQRARKPESSGAPKKTKKAEKVARFEAEQKSLIGKYVRSTAGVDYVENVQIGEGGTVTYTVRGEGGEQRQHRTPKSVADIVSFEKAQEIAKRYGYTLESEAALSDLESPRGSQKRKSLVDFAGGEETGDVKTFQISQRARALFKELDIPLQEKGLAKRLLGLYKRRSKNVRVQSLFDIFTVAHEGVHGISEQSGLIRRLIDNTTKNSPLRKRLTELYKEFYPTPSSAFNPAERRMEEAVAVLFENYLYDPIYVNTAYPDLVETFIDPAGEYYVPKFTQLIEGMSDLIGDYAKMSPDQQIHARLAYGKDVTRKDPGFNVGQRIVFEFFNKLEPLLRYGRMGQVEGSTKDPYVWGFAHMMKNTVIHNWIYGDSLNVIQPDGNYKRVPGSITQYQRMLKGRDLEFNGYLAARRTLEDFNRLSDMEEQLAEMEAAAMNVDAVEADEMPDQEAIDALRLKMDGLMQVLENNQITLQQAAYTVEKNEALFAAPTRIFDRINQSLLEFSVNTGLRSAEYAAELSKIKGYASFIRNINDELRETGAQTFGSRTASALARSFKARTGGTLDINFPSFNQATTIAEVISKGTENVIWNKLYELTKDNPEIARRFEEVAKEHDYVDGSGRTHYKQERDKSLLQFWVDGEPVYVRAAPEILAVAKGLRGSEWEAFARLLRTPSAIFTRLTTSANPLFMLANLPVDAVSSLANTKTKLKPGLDPALGLVEAIKEYADWDLEDVTRQMTGEEGKEQPFKKFLEIGGNRQTFAAQYDITPEETLDQIAHQKSLAQHIKAINTGESVGERAQALAYLGLGIVDSGLSLMELPSNFSEYATRYAEFARAKKQGKSDVEAMYLASEVTVPFILGGRWGGAIGQAWTKSLPYFPAGMQVLYKFARTSRDNPGRMGAVWGGVVLGALGLAVALMRSATDEQKRVLGNLPAGELARAIYLPHWDGKTLIRVRVPEQMGAFSGLAYLYTIQHYGGSKVQFDDWLDSLFATVPQQLNVSEPGKALISWLPQVVKPSVETITNTKTFPEIGPIVPDYLEDMKADELEYTAYTSTVGKKVGEMLGVSPEKIDYWIKAQFGVVGNMLLGKMPNNPLWRQERAYFMAGRAYQNFYKAKDFAMAQHERVAANPTAYSKEVRAEIEKTNVIYEQIGGLLANLRKVVKSGAEIPEETKQQAFNLLMAVDRGEDVSGLSGVVDTLETQTLVLADRALPEKRKGLRKVTLDWISKVPVTAALDAYETMTPAEQKAIKSKVAEKLNKSFTRENWDELTPELKERIKAAGFKVPEGPSGRARRKTNTKRREDREEGRARSRWGGGAPEPKKPSLYNILPR